MAKGNNTAQNENRGRLTVRCPDCTKDMELVRVVAGGDKGMYLVCSCGTRIKHIKGLHRRYDSYMKK
jgi:hypothetical protein